MLFALASTAAPAAALEVEVKAVRTPAGAVSAVVELRDIIPDRFKKTIDEGGALHLRVQAELWEARPVWDRLVYPAIVRVVRMARGSVPPSPMPVTLDLGKSDRLVSSSRYYVHVIATLGTIAERDVDTVGDAVFGRETETNGLGSLGRFVVRTAIQISDYLQSVTAEARSRRLAGADLIRP